MKALNVARLVEDVCLDDLDLDDDDVVTGVIVLVTLLDSDDAVGFQLRHTPQLDWIRRVGIFETAAHIEKAQMERRWLDD